MRPRRIKQLREFINADPCYLRLREEYFREEAEWYEDEFTINKHEYARRKSKQYYSKADWCRNKYLERTELAAS